MKKVFDLMMEGRKVEISLSFRKHWSNCSGLWFSILAINADHTIHLMDEKHQEFQNVPIEEIVFRKCL